MALDEGLKQILACPKCKGPLEFREAEHEIRCNACNLAFPIRDDLPVMLVAEAKPIR